MIKKFFNYSALAIAAVLLVFWGQYQLSDKLPTEIRGAEDHQKAAIKLVVDLAVTGLEAAYKDKTGPVRRDAHAKAHGCVKAVIKVDPDIPDDLKAGLFAEPGKKRKAWIRFSNGGFTPRPDKFFDGRGMALKILDSDPSDTSPTQNVDQYDILMINHPTFFSPEPIDYIDFVKAGALSGRPGSVERYFTPGYNPFYWRLRQAWIGYQIAKKPIESPLRMQYFTMVPFAFGEGRSVKYSSRPCRAFLEQAKIIGDKEDPNYLRTVFRDELKNSAACFELLVQLNDGTMPLNDATVEWKEAASPFRRVALIEIPSQDFSNTAQDKYCENSDFHPGRTYQGFEGLGGLNEMRNAVYTAISNFRHKKNAAEVPDPNLAWIAD